MILLKILITVLMFTGLLSAQAEETTLFSHLPSSLQIHGFASQGYILTENNNFFGDSQDNGSFDFRELGINGSWRPLNDLQLSLQLVSRSAGDTDDGDLRLDYGFADYRLFSDADSLWGIRLGRVVNPYGLYNDTRDVAFTRPSILLPESIYFDVNRNFALSSDGVHIYGEQRSESGDFWFQLGFFEPRTEDPDLERAIFFGDPPGELTGELSWMGRLIYERDWGKWRFALTAAQVAADYKPGSAADPILPGRFKFNPWILSAQYNAEHWSITGEYARRRSRLNNFGVFPDVDFTGESYYIQGTYRFNQSWEALLRYDVLIWDRDDRDGWMTEALTNGLIPAHQRYAKDWTVGLRWDIAPNFMLRAEFHRINGTGWLSSLENDTTERYWNLFTLMGSYRF